MAVQSSDSVQAEIKRQKETVELIKEKNALYKEGYKKAKQMGDRKLIQEMKEYLKLDEKVNDMRKQLQKEFALNKNYGNGDQTPLKGSKRQVFERLSLDVRYYSVKNYLSQDPSIPPRSNFNQG